MGVLFKNGNFGLVGQIFESFIPGSLKYWSWNIIFWTEKLSINLWLKLLEYSLVKEQPELQK